VPSALGLLAALTPHAGHATPPVAAPDPSAPVTRRGQLSPYEKDTLARIARERHLERETEPHGKILEEVLIERLEVLDESDPLPGFAKSALNALHTTSRDFVVRREVLLHPGEVWSDAAVEETGRNLRKLFDFSLALAVPVKGSSPDKVRLLVVVKDIWSLRFSYDLALGKGGLQSVVLQPSESNFAGIHNATSFTFKQLPLSREYGLANKIPRIGTSYIGASVAASVIFNRRTGDSEGTNGALSVGQSLYTTRTPWAWSLGTAWNTSVARRYVDGLQGTYDAKETPEKDNIPFEYLQRNLVNSFGVTRSFGWRNKVDITFGGEYNRRLYRSHNLEGYSPVAVAAFEKNVVPRTDVRVDPIARIHIYQNNFYRLTDVETLALQEDFRLGYDFWFQVYPVQKAFGSTRSFLGLYGAAQYTIPLGNGIARAGVESTHEVQLDAIPDASVTGTLRVVTPKFKIGRLVFDALVLNRYRNYLNRYDFLGGEGRLRGFPTSGFRGKDAAVMNVEFRSRPIDIASVQVGGVLFYDAGNVTDSLAAIRPYQSTGAGVRLLFPQLNRTVFRTDLAFPLTRPLPSGTGPVGFFVSFEQAFAFGKVGPDT